MTKGHIKETNSNKINGNRRQSIINLYMTETKEDTIHFLETYDFEPYDIIDLMHKYSIDFSVSYDSRETIDGYLNTCVIESETLLFYFEDNQIIYIDKKYNILDELREKYNLPY